MRSSRAMLPVAVLAVVVLLGAPAAAHPHEASHAHQGDGQALADSQNHGPLNADGERCGGDPAAYGLETAHHGPDAGTPGKADGDGCYKPGEADGNPGID